jgi:hypothetical protein
MKRTSNYPGILGRSITSETGIQRVVNEGVGDLSQSPWT